ncbi:MAG TPA: hypothetical protein VJ553_00400 [Candidatus Paceibacterota bacterium]|nr:hypothetical protein [Candidatus Paceibacterota bacterium]
MSNEQQPGSSVRPDNPLEAFGLAYGGLSDEAREMQKQLVEEYKKSGTSVMGEVKKWREANPDASYEDAIRALYEMI